MSGAGLDSKLNPKQVFGFLHYQFDLKVGKVRPNPIVLADLGCESTETALKTNQSSPAADVPDSYIKLSPPRSAPYESDTGALEKQWKDPRVTRKGNPYYWITSIL